MVCRVWVKTIISGNTLKTARNKSGRYSQAIQAETGRPDDRAANGWVAQLAKEQARVQLRAKQDFVWNATNITRQMRSQLVALFTDYNARVKLVYVERPYKVWQKQNAGRNAMVPATVLEKMLRKLEVPRLSEAHEVIYKCG